MLGRNGLWSAVAVLLLLSFDAPAATTNDFESILETAAQYRRDGNIRLAIELLERTRAEAGSACPPRLLAELGATYYQANRLKAAEDLLLEAYSRSNAFTERALIANDIGNLYATQGLKDEASRYYEEARTAGSPDVALSAGLNRARLMANANDRRVLLVALRQEIGQVPDRRERARYLVNLGSQAHGLGPASAKLAHDSLTEAQALAETVGDRWLLAQSLDALAQLNEDYDRNVPALRLTEAAIAQLRSDPPQELTVNLQWRRGRLHRGAGRHDTALAAYQSAVDQLEALRQDIPVQYVDGRSSFRATLEPIYLGLSELLMEKAGITSGEQQQQFYRRTRDTLELIKQSELQDYLGDRCAFGNGQPLRGSDLPAYTAVLYPVILENRLELLVETRAGIQARLVAIDAATLREKATGLSGALNARQPYLKRAQELYEVLLRPIESLLAEEKIDTLVVVPDGVLRLVPMGALHDGKQFAISKYAIAVVPGLTTAIVARPDKGIGRILLAGLSEPGPVVNSLPKWVTEQLTPMETARGVRSADLSQRLALPGVEKEIAGLKRETGGDELLNVEFTVAHFREQVASGKYRIIHVASHAVFSSRAQSSFIMAYDGLVTIDELQTLLRSEQVQANPIELLSLSACQTAEGDDRAPLGIAGAAIKAQARSALGSLWPVDDEATQKLMLRFYTLLSSGKTTKAKALQRAQMELIEEQSFKHPFFWASFILVGGWQ